MVHTVDEIDTSSRRKTQIAVSNNSPCLPWHTGALTISPWLSCPLARSCWDEIIITCYWWTWRRVVETVFMTVCGCGYVYPLSCPVSRHAPRAKLREWWTYSGRTSDDWVTSRHSGPIEGWIGGGAEGQMDLEAWKGLSLALGCIFILEEENKPTGKQRGYVFALKFIMNRVWCRKWWKYWVNISDRRKYNRTKSLLILWGQVVARGVEMWLF